MARFSGGGVTTAGSTTAPLMTLYNGGSVVGRIREIGITNNSGTAVGLKLMRVGSSGTPGTNLTAAKNDPDSGAASCNLYNTNTGTPNTSDDLGYSTILGAAAGSGVIWTFGDRGVAGVPGSSWNGVGVFVSSGTGQACQIYFVWDE